jgi:hypothetical protein
VKSTLNDTLVCVLAESRAHSLTWKKFKKNLLDPLRADLAVCIEVTESYDYANPFWNHAKYHWKTPRYDDWGTAFDLAQADLGSNENWRALLAVKDQWLGGVKGEGSHQGSAGILLYFRMFLLKCLQSEEIFKKYKRVVVTRSDFMWDVPHPAIELLEPDAIWIPNGEGYGGVTDRHAVLSQSNHEDYLGILRPVLTDPSQLAREMSGRSDWNLERFIFHSLSRNRAKVKLFPYPAYSVREWGGPTSWSKGKWNFRLGCFVKYSTELREVRKLSALFDEGISWAEIISANSVEQHGKWALNASLASSSHQRLRYNGLFAGLTFHGNTGTLAVTPSNLCAAWTKLDDVAVRYECGKYEVISKKDKKYYCHSGENISKTREYGANCLFDLNPPVSEIDWETRSDE